MFEVFPPLNQPKKHQHFFHDRSRSRNSPLLPWCPEWKSETISIQLEEVSLFFFFVSWRLKAKNWLKNVAHLQLRTQKKVFCAIFMLCSCIYKTINMLHNSLLRDFPGLFGGHHGLGVDNSVVPETLATVLSVSENCRFHAAEKEARTVPHVSRFCWGWRLAIIMNDLFRCDFGIDLSVNLRWKLFVAGVSGLERAATGSHFYLNRMIKSPRYHGQEALRQSAPLPESYLWVARLQFVKKSMTTFLGE